MDENQVKTPAEQTGLFASLSRFAHHVSSLYHSITKRKWCVALLLFALFLALTVVIHIYASRHFDITILWEDDAREYLSLQKNGLGLRVWKTGRPIATFFICLGYLIFGLNTGLLSWYWAAFFALALVCVFLLFYYASGSFWLSALFLGAATFSRLNWYYYIVGFGVMESLALGFSCLSALFLVRYIRSGGWKNVFASALLVACALFSHERFMAMALVFGIVGAIFTKGWWKRLLVLFGGILISGLFIVYKAVFLQVNPFVVTGRTEITTSFPLLWEHFWTIFINCFGLVENVNWYAGMTTEMIETKGALFLGLTLAIGFVLLALAIFDLVRSILKKDWSHFGVYLALGLFYAAIAAGGCVSPSRIETRWNYPPQIFLFAILLFALSSLRLPHFEKGERINEKTVGVTAKAVTGFLLAVGVAVSGLYVLRNRFHFYIDDWYKTGSSYYTQIIDSFQKSGKEKLCIVAPKANQSNIETILSLYPVEGVRAIYDEVGTFPESNQWSQYYFLNYENGAYTRLKYDAEIYVQNTWIQESYSFDCLGRSKTIPIALYEPGNPTGNINAITVKVNGVEKERIEVTEYYKTSVPLDQGSLNHVELIPDFTWNPKKSGTGTDTRDLSLFLVSLGSEFDQDLKLYNFWSDPVYTKTVAPSEDSLLTIRFGNPDLPYLTNYGATVYIDDREYGHYDIRNGENECVLEVEGLKRSEIRVVPDETFNPKELGLNEDIRDLGVYIAEFSLGKKAVSSLGTFPFEEGKVGI